MYREAKRAWDADIYDTPFSFVERKMVEFSHNPEVTEELSKLHEGLNDCGDILQISNPKSNKRAKKELTLFDSSRDAIFELILNKRVAADFKSTLNAALIFDADFPLQLPENSKSTKYTFHYGDSSDRIPDDIYFAEQILPNLLHSECFILSSAGERGSASGRFSVIPHFEFEVQNEFNFFRLLYALQRDILLAYRDEVFHANNHYIYEHMPDRLAPIVPVCENLLGQCSSLYVAQDDIPEAEVDGAVVKIKPNYLVGLSDALNEKLLDLNIGHQAVEKFDSYSFNRLLTHAEMKFLPTCLKLLSFVADLKDNALVIESDLKESRKLSAIPSDLYAFKADKLESALIALNRLWMFREALINPCEIKSLSSTYSLKLQIDHMRIQFESALREQNEEIEKLKRQIQNGD